MKDKFYREIYTGDIVMYTTDFSDFETEFEDYLEQCE